MPSSRRRPASRFVSGSDGCARVMVDARIVVTKRHAAVRAIIGRSASKLAATGQEIGALRFWGRGLGGRCPSLPVHGLLPLEIDLHHQVAARHKIDLLSLVPYRGDDETTRSLSSIQGERILTALRPVEEDTRVRRSSD